MTDAIEAGARAIYEGRNGKGCKPWSILTKAHREPYLSDVKAAIASGALVPACGEYVVVPKALVDLVKIARNEGWYRIHPEWIKIDAMLNAATRTGGEK